MARKGSIDNPASLYDALNSANVWPGDTVYLREGIYTGEWVATVKGTSESRISLRAYPGERVIIDGSLTLGDYMDAVDLEVCRLGWQTRTTAETGSSPSDIPDNSGIILGTGSRAINCTIHNGTQGVVGFNTGFTLYGCIILNNGWQGPDRGHGHGIYSHNSGGSLNTIKHNLFGPNYGWALHLYSAGANPIQNYRIEENATREHRNTIGGDFAALKDIEMNRNILFATYLQLGFASGLETVENLTLDGNTVYGSLDWKEWASFVIQNNAFIDTGTGDYLIDLKLRSGDVSLTCDNNAYYSDRAAPLLYRVPPDFTEQFLDLPGWQSATGLDANSSMSSGYPADSVHVWANEFASISRRKGAVVVLNWTEQNEVQADASALGLTQGSTYRLINAFDPLNDAETFVYDGSGSITVDMVNRSVAVPTGAAAALEAWDKRIGQFVVEVA